MSLTQCWENSGPPTQSRLTLYCGLVLVPFSLAVQALPLQDTSSAMRVTPQMVTPSNRHPGRPPRTRKTGRPMVNIGLGPRSAKIDDTTATTRRTSWPGPGPPAEKLRAREDGRGL
jgi:hypothetical protein